MRIAVRTTGLLGEYLPPGSAPNRAELELPDSATPVDVLRRLAMPANRKYLIAVNGGLVPTASHAERTLADGDEIAIMPPLKGG